MKPKIVVIGSANTDMVVQVDHLPRPGETVLGDRVVITRGGKGANQAIAALRLGAEVTFVARLGCDSFGRECAVAYRDEGLNIDHIIWDDEISSGMALITVDRNGENQITVAQGANAHLNPKDILSAAAAIRNADCLLLQLEIPLETVEAAVELAYQNGVRVILNPAPAQQLPASLLSKVDTLTPNETETGILTGGFSSTHTIDMACSMLIKSGVKNVLITLGARGVLIAGNRAIQIPAFKVKAIDTTGAGDAFNGGLTVALARGMILEEAVRYANAVGALATTRVGAQSSLPTAGEVAAFLGEGSRVENDVDVKAMHENE
jgi:ribokinase